MEAEDARAPGAGLRAAGGAVPAGPEAGVFGERRGRAPSRGTGPGGTPGAGVLQGQFAARPEGREEGGPGARGAVSPAAGRPLRAGRPAGSERAPTRGTSSHLRGRRGGPVGRACGVRSARQSSRNGSPAAPLARCAPGAGQALRAPSRCFLAAHAQDAGPGALGRGGHRGHQKRQGRARPSDGVARVLGVPSGDRFGAIGPGGGNRCAARSRAFLTPEKEPVRPRGGDTFGCRRPGNCGAGRCPASTCCPRPGRGHAPGEVRARAPRSVDASVPLESRACGAEHQPAAPRAWTPQPVF